MNTEESFEAPHRPRRPGDETLEKYARRALEALKADLPQVHAELVRAYEGQAVAVGVFGLGMVVLSIKNGAAQVNPPAKQTGTLVGRGATYPETIAELAAGRLTVLEAYHRGDLAVQSGRSETLHEGYNRMLKYSDAALKSKRLNEVFEDFRRELDIQV